jgi:hypothetical protein
MRDSEPGLRVGARVKPACMPDGQQQQEQQVSAERIARNDATFREANERIRVVAEATELGDDALLPFLCECADLQCTTILQLTGREYEEARANPRWFVKAHGHVRSAQGWARVVEEFERYTLVEKIGEAGAIAEELDPRSAA